MAFKSQYSMSQDAFDGLLTVIGSLLPEDHVLPKSMYEAHKLLRALKMTYEHIHACPKGCVLFRKEYAEAKYYPKCKSSRFVEVDSSDGQKRQLDIPLTILQHLPFIPRIQHLYMTEESAKQMTTLMKRPAHRSTSPTAHLDESYVFSVQTSELMLNTYVRA
jgi:hypothetical protein